MGEDVQIRGKQKAPVSRGFLQSLQELYAICGLSSHRTIKP
jgi:hypothetical protein